MFFLLSLYLTKNDLLSDVLNMKETENRLLIKSLLTFVIFIYGTQN